MRTLKIVCCVVLLTICDVITADAGSWNITGKTVTTAGAIYPDTTGTYSATIMSKAGIWIGQSSIVSVAIQCYAPSTTTAGVVITPLFSVDRKKWFAGNAIVTMNTMAAAWNWERGQIPSSGVGMQYPYVVFRVTNGTTGSITNFSMYVMTDDMNN